MLRYARVVTEEDAMKSGDSGWSNMVAAFEEQRLPVPPVPAALRGSVKLRESWCWSSRGVSSSDMYMFRPYPVHGVFAGQATDYVAVNHAGHGVNSYAVTYQLVYRGLAIFTQLEWGGIYLDNAAAARRMTESFDRITRLINAADERDFTVDSPWRLLCLDSGFRDVSAVSWIRVPDADIDATWRFTTDRRVDPGTALPIAEDLMRVPPPSRKRR